VQSVNKSVQSVILLFILYSVEIPKYLES